MCGGRDFLFDEKWKVIRYLLLNEIDIKWNFNFINNLFFYFYNFMISNNLFNFI